MKTRSQILSIGLAIMFCGLFFVSSALALDFEKWVGTWHSISVKQKGLMGAEINGMNLFKKLKNFSGNDNGYIKFTSFDSNKLGGYIYSIDTNGAWEALPFSAVVLFGDGADCVIETENEVVQSGSYFDQSAILFEFMNRKHCLSLKSIFLKILPCFFIAIFSAALLYAEALPLINTIEIKGLKRIDESAVKSKITQRQGEVISQEKTNEDIKNIYKLGYFDDVRAEIETFEGGIKLIYVVKEKPTIVKIELQGNDEFDDAKLKEKMTITSGAIADAVLIQENAWQTQGLL